MSESLSKTASQNENGMSVRGLRLRLGSASNGFRSLFEALPTITRTPLETADFSRTRWQTNNSPVSAQFLAPPPDLPTFPASSRVIPDNPGISRTRCQTTPILPSLNLSRLLAGSGARQGRPRRIGPMRRPGPLFPNRLHAPAPTGHKKSRRRKPAADDAALKRDRFRQRERGPFRFRGPLSTGTSMRT